MSEEQREVYRTPSYLRGHSTVGALCLWWDVGLEEAGGRIGGGQIMENLGVKVKDFSVT